MPQNEDSDTCRRQEDGMAEPIRKEVSRGREVKEKGGKARKAEKAIERRETNIKEKKQLSNSMELFYSLGRDGRSRKGEN